MSSAVTAPTITANGLIASLRRIGNTLAAKSREIAGTMRVTASRVADSVARQLAIPPTAVLPLVLIALVVVALAFVRRA